MVSRSDGPFVLSGAVSLDGAPLPPCPHRAETLFYGRTACVFRTGASRDLHLLRDGPGLLALAGRTFSPFAIHPGAPDLEARLLRLEAEGPRAVEGSFALVRVDAQGGVQLATDRYGFRPLLYRRTGGLLLFATHLRGLAALAPLPASDGDALLHYYNFGVTPNDRTLLEGVSKMPPGSLLVADRGEARVAPYFHVGTLYDPARFEGATEEDLCRAIDERLTRAVRRRTEGAGPVGVALSGGVDSGLLAAKAAQGGATVVGYTLAFGHSYDEFRRVDFLARRLGIETRRIRVTAGEVIANFEYCNGLASEPVAFNNATMRFAGVAARADGVRTLLDGDGADRLFLGMSRHGKWQRLLRVYGWLERHRLLPYVAPLLGRLPSNELRKAGLHFENWRRGIPPYAERGLGRVGRYDEGYERRVYELAVARHRESFVRRVGEGDFGLFLTWVAVQMCPEMFFHDPAELQQELGLFPVPAFWDDEVVAVALSLDTRWKLRDGRTKYILREAARRSLDEGYWRLPKIGFQRADTFAFASAEGRAWRARRIEEARASAEARRLARMLPDDVEPERLIPVLAWKERHGIA
ncbi:MAG TPA: asparagine synthase-related protein [Planctomycetota bacterium]|nr:asparagine synthase-related protein [Planctomycetota bacterium]